LTAELEYVCRQNELASGQMKAFQVGRRSIVLVRGEGDFYALRNLCPHQGAELSEGWLSGTALPSPVGEVHYGRAGEILRCPWHNWEFDVRTGRSLHDPDHERVRAYSVVVRESEVYVDLGRAQVGGEG
jgi:nitrite reductase/ring-hydroxylating ferredoxin subunit